MASLSCEGAPALLVLPAVNPQSGRSDDFMKGMTGFTHTHSHTPALKPQLIIKRKQTKEVSFTMWQILKEEVKCVLLGSPAVTCSELGSASEVEGFGDSGPAFSCCSWIGTAIWLRSMVGGFGLDSAFSFTADRKMTSFSFKRMLFRLNSHKSLILLVFILGI